MIHRSNLELIVEDWYDIALRMKNDEKANKAFGWILEMVRFPALCCLCWPACKAMNPPAVSVSLSERPASAEVSLL